MENLNDLVFSEETGFEEKVETVFEHQFNHNPVYSRFCEALKYEKGDSGLPPLLPIRAFKNAEITCRPEKEPDLIFRSSGTSGMERSKHLVADAEIYRQSLLSGFSRFYDLENAVIWGFLPGYSENPDSSLTWMINELIKKDDSGFSRFLDPDQPLDADLIRKIQKADKQLILFGAAFGLLDLVESDPLQLPRNSIIIETGGMKTHRREITRDELHQKLSEGFGLHHSRIHSEYGMTELLSQAYATGGEWFKTVPWMKISIRNPDNPLEELKPFQEGLIGVIDLANLYSCSFLLTGDRGVMHSDGRFKILGRWNPKDLRGCNFLIEED